MKISRRIFICVLCLTLFLGLSGSVVLASETHTSKIYNHGTIGVTAEGGGDTIEIFAGESTDLTISPYVHVQYLGCQMGTGENACPDICGGQVCFVKGKGCQCVPTPKKRTTAVTVTPANANVVTAGTPTASGDAGSEVGSMVDGTVTLTGAEAGETTVTVTASLCDWVSANKTFTVKVKEPIANVSNDFYTYTFDADTHGYRVGLSAAFRAQLDKASGGSLTGSLGSGTEKITWKTGEALPNPAPGGKYNDIAVTDMSKLFAGSTAASLDLSAFDASNVEMMTGMFKNCAALTKVRLCTANTAKLKDVSSMFEKCSALGSLEINGLNTSGAVNMQNMFSQCKALKQLDLSGLSTASAVSLSGLFDGCTTLETVDVSGFDTAKVTDMSSMFRDCSALSSLDLSSFDVTMTANFANMFSGTCRTSGAAAAVTGLAKNRAAIAKFMSKTAGCYDQVLKFKTKTYKVTLVGAGGGTQLTSYDADYGATLPSDWTREGYTFDGWYTTPDFSGSRIGRITRDDLGDKTYYAKWNPLTYTISYAGVNNADNSMNPATYTPENSVRLKTPKRSGYTFVGWYNSNGKKTTSIQKGSVGNVSLTAKWYKNPAVPKVKVKAGSKQFTVKCGRVSRAVKYQVKYHRSGTSTWKTKTLKTTSLKVKKLKKGRRYSVKVRALGKYGSSSSYSKVKTVKIK
ncbi:MAG: BspA family leucine-rich repeat surface protein [Anaerovoracaceae bacterium]|jgi:uncharacterized repeat protein (TIGR02543 family)